MKKRKLRNLEVSAIGYGCMGLSHGYGKLPERKEAVRLIQSAFELGCTFFDTAEGYGLGANEELLGEALTNIRSKAVIATKLHIRNESNLKEQIEKRLDASLKRLGTVTGDSRRDKAGKFCHTSYRNTKRIFHDGAYV